jgi:hypothetical protein
MPKYNHFRKDNDGATQIKTIISHSRLGKLTETGGGYRIKNVCTERNVVTGRLRGVDLLK